MTPRPTPLGRSTTGDTGRGFALFLLLGWLVVVAAPLSALPDRAGLLLQTALFLLLWMSCRLPPFRRLALGRLLRTRPERDLSTTPLWQPATRVLAFLALSGFVLNPYWLGLAPWPSPAGEGAALGLALLALALMWRWQGGPRLRAVLRGHALLPSQAAVAGIALGWGLDLAWLVHQRRLPEGVLDPAVLLPSVLLLSLGAELLVLSLLWRWRRASGEGPPTGRALPLWLALAVLLLTLAARRPGLALGTACFAAWLELSTSRDPAGTVS